MPRVPDYAGLDYRYYGSREVAPRRLYGTLYGMCFSTVPKVQSTPNASSTAPG
jgi:hypothetical protein